MERLGCGCGYRVVVALRHPSMREFACRLLRCESGCAVLELADPQGPCGCPVLLPSDLLVVDAADFPACCDGSPGGPPRRRVVVVAPEPDPAYRAAAARHGAGAWVARERLGDDLVPEILRLAGRAGERPTSMP